MDFVISVAEVTKVVKKLLAGRPPGVDEIRPEFLKALDFVGMTQLQRHMVIRGGTAGLAGRGGGPSF